MRHTRCGKFRYTARLVIPLEPFGHRLIIHPAVNKQSCSPVLAQKQCTVEVRKVTGGCGFESSRGGGTPGCLSSSACFGQSSVSVRAESLPLLVSRPGPIVKQSPWCCSASMVGCGGLPSGPGGSRGPDRVCFINSPFSWVLARVWAPLCFALPFVDGE